MDRSEKLNILHLEDNANDAELIRTMLEQSSFDFENKWVENESDFIKCLRSEKYDFILSDYNLTGYDGLSALRKAVILQPDTPFIFVSGTLGEDVAVETLKKGATDYVLKNNLNRLIPTMQRAMEEVHETNRRKQAEGRYSTLIEAASEIIFTISTNGEITTLNNAFEKETRWDRLGWIGKDFRTIVHPGDIERSEEKLGEALQGKVSDGFELRIQCKDGNFFTGEILITPMFQAGKVTEILGFVRNVSDRKKNEETIRNSLKEKETLLKEIHHRVKNNLQIVSSLLRMQANAIDDKTVSDYLKISEQRVKSMALLHQQLYKTDDLSRIDFNEYVNELCSYLYSSYGINQSRISLDINIQNIFFDIDTALPCGLIINELVTNSLKHAFPDDKKGNIYIEITKTNDKKNHMVITDDGIGSHDGLNINSDSPLGMMIVRSLAEQLEAEIEMTIENGTKIGINFFDLIYKKRI